MAVAAMHLDVGTLSVVTVFVTALLDALLVFAGVQNRSIRAPMWWGAGNIVGALGLGSASSDLHPFVAVEIANALVLLGYGLTWAGARVFDGRKVLPLVVVFAPMVWLFACRIPAFETSSNLRGMMLSAMTAMLAAATAEEFWRGRAEPLLSRWPTVIVLLAYAAALLARIPASSFSPLFDTGSVLDGLSFALIAFGTLLFTVVMSFLLLNMTKERTELQHKINAMIDPLSGVANRRAFLEAPGNCWRITRSIMSRSRWCCSTWIASRKSTIVWAMRWATGSCRHLQLQRPRPWEPTFFSAASGEQSSLRSCRLAILARPMRWLIACAETSARLPDDLPTEISCPR
jgi:hypothetical protein